MMRRKCYLCSSVSSSLCYSKYLGIKSWKYSYVYIYFGLCFSLFEMTQDTWEWYSKLKNVESATECHANGQHIKFINSPLAAVEE